MSANEFSEKQPTGSGSTDSSQKPKRNMLAITFAALAVIACCCLIGGALIVWQDPFDWNLLARLQGNYDAAAEALPEDTLIYVGMDLLQLRTQEIQQVIKAIADSDPNVEFSTPDEALGDLDDQMSEELAFNFTEDILPWVGQYAGFGVMDLQLDEFGNIETADIVFAASVRDRAAAEAFTVKFRQQLETDYGSPMTVSEHEGASVYEIEGADGIAFALYKSLFLVGNSSASIRESIDAKNSVSFMDAQFFKELSDQLPAGRILTGFFTRDLLDEFIGELQDVSAGLPGLGNFDYYQGVAFSLSFTGQGVQFDFATRLDPETLPVFQKELGEAYAVDFRLDERMPAETLVYLAGARPDLSWQLFLEQAENLNTRQDVTEAMAAFNEEFGFNPETDLFPNLDGEYLIAIVQSNEGLMASEGIPLGLSLVFETSNPAGLVPVVAGLDKLIAGEFGVVPAPVDVGGHSLQQVSAPFIGDIATYGLTDDLLLLASSTGLAGEIVGGESALTANPDYQAVWTAFPEGTRPVLYANVSGLVGSIVEGMSVEERESFYADIGSAVTWIDNIAMGARYSTGGTQLSTLIIFVAGMDSQE